MLSHRSCGALKAKTWEKTIKILSVCYRKHRDLTTIGKVKRKKRLQEKYMIQADQGHRKGKKKLIKNFIKDFTK